MHYCGINKLDELFDIRTWHYESILSLVLHNCNDSEHTGKRNVDI